MKPLPLLLFLTWMSWVPLDAQKKAPDSLFLQRLDAMGLEWLQPADARLKTFLPAPNPYENFLFAYRLPREDLELRFALYPESSEDPASQNPSLLAFRSVTSAATNDPEYRISLMEMEPEQARLQFNADGALLFFFHPKPDLAPYEHCRLLVLYKAGQGTALVYFFFDDPDNPTLDTRLQTLRFRDKPRNF